MNLPSLPNYVGAILTLLIHELSDYPQTVMAGIIAAKFFPKQSKAIFGAFAVIPLMCKSLKHLKINSRVLEAPDHMIRILGKAITTGQAIVNCYLAPDLRKLLYGIALILTSIKDFNNTKSYLQQKRRSFHFDWNYRYFDESYL